MRMSTPLNKDTLDYAKDTIRQCVEFRQTTPHDLMNLAREYVACREFIQTIQEKLTSGNSIPCENARISLKEFIDKFGQFDNINSSLKRK